MIYRKQKSHTIIFSCLDKKDVDEICTRQEIVCLDKSGEHACMTTNITYFYTWVSYLGGTSPGIQRKNVTNQGFMHQGVNNQIRGLYWVWGKQNSQVRGVCDKTRCVGTFLMRCVGKRILWTSWAQTYSDKSATSILSVWMPQPSVSILTWKTNFSFHWIASVLLTFTRIGTAWSGIPMWLISHTILYEKHKIWFHSLLNKIMW